jgi:5'-nucleotidase
MHILVTNDDGLHAPGLLALVQAARSIGDTTVIAPERNWSASGHVKTMHRPLRVRETNLRDGTEALVTDGAPSDCVALACLGLVEQPIDLVISGINPNANIGDDVTYSGTVTAAMEAALAGKRGIAFSLDSPDGFNAQLDYGPAEKVVRILLQRFSTEEFPKGSLLNINIPYLPVEEMKGVAITRQGLRVYRDALEKREDPRGKRYYWIGGEPPTGLPEPGTDFWALAEGMVSVTPLQMDLTSYLWIDTLKGWDLEI